MIPLRGTDILTTFHEKFKRALEIMTLILGLVSKTLCLWYNICMTQWKKIADPKTSEFIPWGSPET